MLRLFYTNSSTCVLCGVLIDTIWIYLDIVFFSLWLDGLDGTICRVDEAYGVAEKHGTVPEHQPESDERDHSCEEQKIIFKERTYFWRHFPGWTSTRYQMKIQQYHDLSQQLGFVWEIWSKTSFYYQGKVHLKRSLGRNWNLKNDKIQKTSLARSIIIFDETVQL